MSQRLNALINETSQSKIYYSTSFHRFLQDNRKTNVIARLLSNYWDDTYNLRPAYRFMFTTSEINYITFRNDGTISYLPNGKEHKLNDDGKWSSEGRQHGKPAKVIRKLFTQKAQSLIKDADFESFTNKYKSAFSNEGYSFDIIPANKIPSIYRLKDSERMAGDSGLNSSCMNNADANFFDIYKHCKSLRMVVLYNAEKKLAGRSLLWNVNDSDGNTIELLDRIYVAQDFLFESFIAFAKKNNFWYKVKYNSRDSQCWFFNQQGNKVNEVFTVNTPTSFDAYPYIDTFQYGGEGYLSNDNDGTCYEYDCTDGSRSGDSNFQDNSVWDEIDECDISQDDAVEIDRGSKRGRFTHRNNVVEIGGYYYWKEDDEIVYISGHGYCHQDDVVYCERDGEDYHRDDCIETHDNEWILESESITTEDGNVYHEEDDDVIEIDGLWYEKDSDDVCYIEKQDEYYLITSNDIVEINGSYYHITDDEIVNVNGDYYHIDDDDIIKIGRNWYLKDSDEVIELDGDYILRQLSLFDDNAAA